MVNREGVTQVRIDLPVKRIGLISDTHIPSRGKALTRRIRYVFQKVQLILHAGDIVEMSVLNELRRLAPVEAVAGNMDPAPLHICLGRKKLIRVGRVKIGLVHGDGGFGGALERARKAFSGYDPQVIVFGHSHRPYCREEEGIWLINPGSAVDPRWEPGPSCGLLTIEGDSIQGQIIYL